MQCNNVTYLSSRARWPQVINTVDCAYCGAVKGALCHGLTADRLRPHPSRITAAADVLGRVDAAMRRQAARRASSLDSMT
jgi:hypothetical protein